MTAGTRPYANAVLNALERLLPKASVLSSRVCRDRLVHVHGRRESPSGVTYKDLRCFGKGMDRVRRAS